MQQLKEQFNLTDIYLNYCIDANTAPAVRIEPTVLQVDVGQPVEFRCIATGIPRPTLTWTRGQDGTLAPGRIFQDGVFRIVAAQTSDRQNITVTP